MRICEGVVANGLTWNNSGHLLTYCRRDESSKSGWILVDYCLATEEF